MPFRRRRSLPPEALPPEAPPPEGTPPERDFWPWLAALLILALGGLAAAYILAADDDAATSGATVTAEATTSPRLSVPEPATETDAETEAATAATTAAEDTVPVPRVVGLREEAAAERLRDARLAAETRAVFADRSEGVVVRQRPRPAQEVEEGTRVLLEVSKGPRPSPVPSVTGVSEADAAARLEAAGFAVVVYDVPAAEPKGTVVAQEPKAGEQAPGGSRVRINVSTGAQEGEEAEREPPATVTVADYVGQKRKQAMERIRRAGLKPDPKYVPSSEPRDTVIAQSPKPGETVERGSGVRINVSAGAKPKPEARVPDVLGDDEPTATEELERAGFVVEVVQQDTEDPAEDGVVLEQSPLGDARAPAGSTVTIVVGFLVADG